MTPKEKAEELVNKYYHLFAVDLENTIDIYEAKQCALLAVEQIFWAITEDGDYWEEVKSEIEKLKN
jgi:hypothetical protein